MSRMVVAEWKEKEWREWMERWVVWK